MDKIDKFVDEREESWCIQCGAWVADVETSEDHVPSKGLLQKPCPANLPVVTICTTCNNGFSADEEYLLLFLHCVLAGSTDPKRHADEKVGRALRRHDKLRARVERSKAEYRTGCGETRIVWKPETERVKRVVVKNARGHAFYEYGEPMLTEPEHVWTLPLVSMAAAEREEFENAGTTGELAPWPEMGSRMMTRVVTGQDMRDGWIIVQDGVYRFRAEQRGAMLVRSVVFEYPRPRSIGATTEQGESGRARHPRIGRTKHLLWRNGSGERCGGRRGGEAQGQRLFGRPDTSTSEFEGRYEGRHRADRADQQADADGAAATATIPSVARGRGRRRRSGRLPRLDILDEFA